MHFSMKGTSLAEPCKTMHTCSQHSSLCVVVLFTHYFLMNRYLLCAIGFYWQGLERRVLLSITQLKDATRCISKRESSGFGVLVIKVGQ